MNLEECYEAIDSDYDDVMRRLGSETLVRKFVLKFLDDTSFQGLKEGLENQDAELAFRSAHTLKGVCRKFYNKCMRNEIKVSHALILF